MAELSVSIGPVASASSEGAAARAVPGHRRRAADDISGSRDFNAARPQPFDSNVGGSRVDTIRQVTPRDHQPLPRRHKGNGHVGRQDMEMQVAVWHRPRTRSLDQTFSDTTGCVQIDRITAVASVENIGT